MTAKYMVNVLSGAWNWETNPWTEDSEEYQAIDPTTGADFERFFGNDIDFGENGIYAGNRHAVLNGYHFIAVEPNSYGAEYTATTRTWLREQLEAAVLDNPDRPIFVITHPKMYDTVYASKASNENVAANLLDILNDFPQVFVWTGHTHCPLNEDDAIMQNKFTAIEGSSTSYLSNLVGKFAYPEESWLTGQHTLAEGQFLELDANGNMRITPMDMIKSYNQEYESFSAGNYSKYANSSADINEPWIINNIGADGAHLYAYDNTRKLNSTKPYFNANASVTAEDSDSGITVTFDSAADDGNIRYYKVNATNISTGEITSANVSSMYFYYPQKDEMPESYSYTFADLTGADEYVFEVYAYDEWEHESKALRTQLDTSTEFSVLSVTKTEEGCDTEISLKNNSGKDIKDASVIVAFYDGNKLVSSKIISGVNVANGNTETFTALLDCELSEFNVKCFAWKSLGNMVPVIGNIVDYFNANGFQLK